MAAPPVDWYGLDAAGEDDLALPASGVPTPSVDGKDLEQPAALCFEVGVFIGIGKIGFCSSFIFLDSLPNDERIRWNDDDDHSRVFATPTLRHGNPRFSVGVPYWFHTRLESISKAPDGAPVYEICGNAREIKLFHSNDEHPHPVLRCTFLGANDKFLRCKAIETHSIRLDREPVFSIFKDQQVVTTGGDFLIN